MSDNISDLSSDTFLTSELGITDLEKITKIKKVTEKINNKGYLSWIKNYSETSKIYLYFITGDSQYSYLLKCSNLCNIFKLKNEKKR